MPRYKHGCSDYPMRGVWKDEGQRKGGGGGGGTEWGVEILRNTHTRDDK